MPQYPDAAYFTLVPDWICKTLSPSARVLDQGVKRTIYAREGLAHIWFVAPDAHTLKTPELRDGQWLFLEILTDNAQSS
ncbi:MAG: Uma2 family endonuclease [Gammaproteobacteria bacterium]|nr:Uma2 family endonuclease [Gammaproteobacteria bacterium]